MYKTTSNTYGNFYQSNIFNNDIKYSNRCKIINNNLNQKCIICQNKISNQFLRVLPCGHFFHIECIDYWMCDKMNCPICRCSL